MELTKYFIRYDGNLYWEDKGEIRYCYPRSPYIVGTLPGAMSSFHEACENTPDNSMVIHAGSREEAITMWKLLK